MVPFVQDYSVQGVFQERKTGAGLLEHLENIIESCARVVLEHLGKKKLLVGMLKRKQMGKKK